MGSENNQPNRLGRKPLTSLLLELKFLFKEMKENLEDIIVEKAQRTLDEVLDTRGIIGVEGGLGEILLSPRDIASIYGGVDTELKYSFIDSSSRSIGFNPLRITVSAVAVKTRKGLLTEPHNTVSWRFIAVKSLRQVLERLEKTSSILRVRNPCGEYYDEEYKDDNIGDELRLEIENYGLREIVSRGDVVVIDGPIYPTPEIIFYGRENRYAKAFLKLIEERLSIINEEQRLVIGFVKRTEYSRKLWRNNEIREIVKSISGREPGSVPDPLIVEYIVEKKAKPRIGEWRVLGPFTIKYNNKLLEAKVFYYVALKSVNGYYVYRVEFLERDYRGRKELFNRIILALLENTSIRGIPLGIELVDKVSRRITAALYILLREYLSGILSLAYDELGREADIIRELAE